MKRVCDAFVVVVFVICAWAAFCSDAHAQVVINPAPVPVCTEGQTLVLTSGVWACGAQAGITGDQYRVPFLTALNTVGTSSRLTFDGLFANIGLTPTASALLSLVAEEGAELVDGTWTLGAGWSEPDPDEFEHTPGSTATLTHPMTIVAGRLYCIAISAESITAGEITITLGGEEVAVLEAESEGIEDVCVRASDTTALIITPTSDADGLLYNISVGERQDMFRAGWDVEDAVVIDWSGATRVGSLTANGDTTLNYLRILDDVDMEGSYFNAVNIVTSDSITANSTAIPGSYQSLNGNVFAAVVQSDSNIPFFRFSRYADAGAAITDGWVLARISFEGAAAGGIDDSANIDAVADGSVAGSAVPARLRFSTRPVGGSPTVRLDIRSTGAFDVCGDVGTTGQILTANTGACPTWETAGGGSGTVTSVAMSVPTGLSISGSPITGSGTLALSLTSGYMIPGGGTAGAPLVSGGGSAPTFGSVLAQYATNMSSTIKAPIMIQNNVTTIAAGNATAIWAQLSAPTGGACNTGGNPALDDFVLIYGCMESDTTRETSFGTSEGMWGVNIIMTAQAGHNMTLYGGEIDIQNVSGEGTNVPAAWAQNGKVGWGVALASTGATNGDGSAGFSTTVNGSDLNDLWKYGYEAGGVRTASFYARRSTNIGTVDPLSAFLVDSRPSYVLNSTVGLTIAGMDIYGETGSASGYATLAGTGPQFNLYERDASSNEKYWRIHSDGGVFKLQTVNDAYNSATSVLEFTRAGVPTFASPVPGASGGTGYTSVKLAGITHTLSTSYISGTGTTGADGANSIVKSITVPANTLTQVGDRIRIRVHWAPTTGTAIVGRLAFNGTTVGTGVTVGTATSGTGTAEMQTWVTLEYIDATHANIWSYGTTGVFDASTSVPNSASFAWASDQLISLEQSNIANNHIIVYSLTVEVWPKGVVAG